MRISDWSSDVCSSDLDVEFLKDFSFRSIFADESQHIKNPDSQRHRAICRLTARTRVVITGTPVENNTFDLYGQLSFACQIGRASCRERVCQYVSISVVAVSLKKKKKKHRKVGN